MKLSTEICKEKLIDEFGAGIYKRINKRKEGEKTVREFSRGDGISYVVISDSDDNVIEKVEKVERKPFKTVPKNKYYFALVNVDYNDNCFSVYIEPRKHWEEEHCLADHYEDEESEEIEAVCRDIDLLGDMESIYSFDRPITKAEAKELLLSRGFAFSKAVQDFMTEDEQSEKECRAWREKEKKDDAEYKAKEEEKRKTRTPEQVYVDEHIGEAMAKLKNISDYNSYFLVSKYMGGYKGNLLVATVKMYDGKEMVLPSEYLRAYLVNERKYELIKELMELK